MNKETNNFKQRCKQKQSIHSNKKQIFFKQRDIFFISMGKNIRFEQNGKGINFSRPVVIVKKFNNDIFWGIALSTKEKHGKYYFNFKTKNTNQCAILSQLRLYDKNRLIKKIGMINQNDFLKLKEKTKHLL